MITFEQVVTLVNKAPRSRPEVKAVQDWIEHEVIPQIVNNGFYNHDEYKKRQSKSNGRNGKGEHQDIKSLEGFIDDEGNFVNGEIRSLFERDMNRLEFARPELNFDLTEHGIEFDLNGTRFVARPDAYIWRNYRKGTGLWGPKSKNLAYPYTDIVTHTIKAIEDNSKPNHTMKNLPNLYPVQKDESTYEDLIDELQIIIKELRDRGYEVSGGYTITNRIE